MRTPPLLAPSPGTFPPVTGQSGRAELGRVRLSDVGLRRLDRSVAAFSTLSRAACITFVRSLWGAKLCHSFDLQRRGPALPVYQGASWGSSVHPWHRQGRARHGISGLASSSPVARLPFRCGVPRPWSRRASVTVREPWIRRLCSRISSWRTPARITERDGESGRIQAGFSR
jgi:hypothetical protein